MTTGNHALKVGIFYDGSYFNRVSNYYNYVHAHRRRLHIGGLHDFVKHALAEREGTKPNLCHIVDAHFFQGRFSAREANEKTNRLYYDRVFDDVLMYNAVQTHHLPVKDLMGRKREKGIDVLMALETYELAMLKKLDVVVLVAADGDHVPLARKLHALGCKTMLLGWDFEYTDQESGEQQITRTSTDLWNEVSYPMPMHDLIEEGLEHDDAVIREMFVVRESYREQDADGVDLPQPTLVDDERHRSTVMSIMNGYGFIRYPDNNLFFRFEDLQGFTAENLHVNDEVEFHIAVNNKGQRVARNVSIAQVDV
jgi:uncharacterized LabA/DUF88 family protein/cold shock CspA family protein